MAQYQAGTAFLQVLPSLKGFHQAVRSELRGVGSSLGQAAGQETEKALAPTLTKIRSDLSSVGSSAESAGKTAGQALGSRLASAAAPGLAALGRFRDGFTNASTAASGLAGAAGTVGGATRRAIDPVLGALGKVRDGWSSSTAAASAFSGVAGTVGGVARRAFDGVTGTLGRVRDGFVSGEAAASAFSGRAGTLGGALRSGLDGARSAVGRLGGGFTELSGHASGVFSRIGESIKSGIQAPIVAGIGLLKQFGALAGVAGAGSAVFAGVNRLSQIEQANVALKTMMGNAEKAKGFLDEVLAFAKTTPFAFPDLANAARNLVAFGMDARNVIPTLEAVGNAAAGAGQGSAGLTMIADAFGAIQVAGRLSLEEVNRLSANGIPALQILANQAGITANEMRDQISKGAVDSNTAISGLVKGIQEGTRGIAGETPRFAGLMNQMKDTWVGSIDSLKSSISSTMATLIEPALPHIRAGMKIVGDEFKKLPDLVKAIGSNEIFQEITGGIQAFFGALRDGGNDITSSGLAGFLEAVGLAARNMWEALWPAVKFLGSIAIGAAVTAFRLLGAALDYVSPIVVKLSEWLRPLTPIIVGIAVAVGGFYAVAGTATLVVAGFTKAVAFAKGVILSVRTAVWLLNAAFAANPIGLVVALIAGLVAGVIYAWHNFEGFRNVVTAVWGAIKTAALWAWNNALKPAFDGIVTAAKAVGAAAVWLWENALRPAWDGIVTAARAVGAAFSWLWSTILKPVFGFIGDAALFLAKLVIALVVGPIVAAWELLGAAFSWVWSAILKPVFDAVAAAGLWLWTNALLPAFRGIQAIWDGLVAAMKWAWENILRPAWDAISAAATWLWTNVLSPVFGWIKDTWDRLLLGMKVIWENVLKPAWDAVAAAATWLWSNVLRPVFDWIKAGWDALGAAFRWIYDHIIKPTFDFFASAAEGFKNTFDRIVGGIKRIWEGIKEAFKAPVRFVIETVWNKGIGWLWDKAKSVFPLGDFPRVDLSGWATGGSVHGPGTGTSDSIPALLSDGEHVWTAREVRAAGGHGYVESLRQAALDGNLPRFAKGGPVRWDELWDVVRRAFPTARLTSAVRRGDSGEHGAGRAIDVAGPRPMDKPFMLNVNRWIAANYPDSHELIHTPGINLFNGRPHTYNAATRAGHHDHVHWARVEKGGMLDVLGLFARRPGLAADIAYYTARDQIQQILDEVVGVVRGWVTAAFPGNGTMVGDFPLKAFDWAWGKARDFLFGKADEADAASNSAAAGSPEVIAAVQAVASRYGWGSGPQWDALSKLIQGESSWNPNAANPSSSARGLFQKMTSIHGPVEPTPAGQAEWGLNYIRRAYGDPVTAYSRWLSRSPHWYDRGGLAVGPGLLPKLTAKPERVLSPRQTSAFESLVAVLGDGAYRGGGGPRQVYADQQLADGVRGGDGAETLKVEVLAREPLSSTEIDRLAAEVVRRQQWARRSR
ncbi:tape measure protein [Pseudonocardia asaccharolytica]|uniref:Tape measure protein N-terminal domain-containing protein n=1 Tax=Pseudonocardia asaccharolytica DSM 44247 = NBRC 16224 TaxID=1123024 RepID=A0A511D3L7_9PSEU|nr:tape measure protein [Pseudonocardia asaccharolytica]GEL19365.1 hypothetical protein PA7_32020 [Pseudonocardia asaccharolytica DSM 44247 = NBRC 16224]